MKNIMIVALLFSVVVTSSLFAGEASHKRAALELLEVANTQEMLDQMMSSISDMMEQQFKALKLPPGGEEAAAAFQREIIDWFSEFFVWEQMRDLYVDIYVDVFTEDELKELIRFYQSPLGQKVLKKMPELMQKSIEKTQALLQSKMPEFQKRLQKTISELKEKYKKDESSDMKDTSDAK